MKIVPFYPNTPDNTHCLQACVKSVLSSFFPDRGFTNKEVNEKTGQAGGWSWLPPAAVWLDELGLNIKLYSEFDYQAFGIEGENFLKKSWSAERFNWEKDHGAFNNLMFVQEATREMVKRGLWKNSSVEVDKLVQLLEKDDVLAIGKTVHDWLAGNYTKGNAHYIVVIKEYAPTQWLVHDPGLQAVPNRKISKSINNHSIFGEIVLIAGKKVGPN